ncbi:putative nucleic acid-binding Zn ribbon protein [Nocardioides zeae]|uniref:Nucleic acid-binding Zn ribbon protein n=1 Tax=Nocardioides zeae TaxID=1457234 RepID=A0ACC6IKL2_9ACTN|nr:putative nucleic acid-binding Zn ribbon protein [Nocardioides zeae]MDR6211027.1 putative nucleic acid-binding Zn ribbon protein [Nocardioides zeae]
MARRGPVEQRRLRKTLQYSLLVILSIVTVVLCYLAVTRTP